MKIEIHENWKNAVDEKTKNTWQYYTGPEYGNINDPKNWSDKDYSYFNPPQYLFQGKPDFTRSWTKKQNKEYQKYVNDWQKKYGGTWMEVGNPMMNEMNYFDDKQQNALGPPTNTTSNEADNVKAEKMVNITFNIKEFGKADIKVNGPEEAGKEVYKNIFTELLTAINDAQLAVE